MDDTRYLRGRSLGRERMATIRLGEHHRFVVINRRLKATPEHPFMIRRGDEWGFASAEFIQPGDFLIDEHMNEEEVDSVVRVDAPIRTVSIHIPGTNTLLAEGVWVHNDMPANQTAVSGSSTLTSGSGSGSASSADSESGSGSMSGSSSGPSSSGSSSGSKSSGSSSFSTSGSTSGSSSGSGSGSMSGSSSSGGGTGTFSI